MSTNITNGQDVAAAQQKLTQAQTRKTTAAAQQSSAQSLFSSTPQYIEQAKEQTTTDSTGKTVTETIMEKILNPKWQEALNALNEANYELSSAEEEVSEAEEEVSEVEEAEEEAKAEEEEAEAAEEEATEEETEDDSLYTLPEYNTIDLDGNDDSNGIFALNKPDYKDLNPDNYAQDYADKNGMTLDEAKSELKEKFGEADPDKYARKYASVYGMTLDEAKEELKSKFGDPSSTTDSTNSTTDATSDTIPEGVDPDTYAQEYADANGLTLDKAKEELKSKFGEPDYDKNSDMIPSQADPDTYAQEYADKNGVSIEEAREALKAKYGEPKAKDDSTTDSTTDATSDTIPEGVDPDTYAQEYADANGITVDEAKEVLKGKYGEPEYDENRNTDSTEELTEQEQELQSKGIPVEIINQGADAIRKYAKDHDIELNNPEE